MLKHHYKRLSLELDPLGSPQEKNFSTCLDSGWFPKDSLGNLITGVPQGQSTLGSGPPPPLGAGSRTSLNRFLNATALGLSLKGLLKPSVDKFKA